MCRRVNVLCEKISEYILMLYGKFIIFSMIPRGGIANITYERY